MPSSRAILLGLLKFGALSVTEKKRVVDEYLAHCSSTGGGPHNDDLSWEAIWSLRTYTKPSVDITDPAGRQLLSNVHELSDRLLKHEDLEPVWNEDAIFVLPVSLELESACKEAVAYLTSADVEDLPFGDLMCYTCD